MSSYSSNGVTSRKMSKEFKSIRKENRATSNHNGFQRRSDVSGMGLFEVSSRSDDDR
jgi:hypothetical protein